MLQPALARRCRDRFHADFEAARFTGEDRAHAGDMAAELAAIVADLGLPEFQVPAPTNSAQHTAAAAQRGRADLVIDGGRGECAV